MFVHYRTEGFVLKKRDSGEVDRIFTIYTKDFGKLNLLAKAERKITSKLRAGLELFYLSEIEFIQGKVYKTLTDTILINNFQNLRKDLKKLVITSKILESLDDLVKGEEADKKMWVLLEDIFEKLNSFQLIDNNYQLLYYYFLWNLLSILGYQLEFYHCSLCQKKLIPEKIYFNPEEGGLTCDQCKESTRKEKQISSDTVKIIRIFLKKDWLTLKKLKLESKNLKELKTVSDYYFAIILEEIK